MKKDEKQKTVEQIVTVVLAAVGKKAYVVPDAKRISDLEAFRERYDRDDSPDTVMVAERSVLDRLRARFGNSQLEHRISVIV